MNRERLTAASQRTEYNVGYAGEGFTTEPAETGWTTSLEDAMQRLNYVVGLGPERRENASLFGTPQLVERMCIPAVFGAIVPIDFNDSEDYRFCASWDCRNERADMLTMLCAWHDVNGEDLLDENAP